MFSLSRTWIYEQVWWNEKFWVMSITIYQTSQNCTHVHPGERRGAHRKIFTLNTHHVYIKWRQYAPISLYLKDSYDLWTVSYSILYRTSTWSPAVRIDNFSSSTAMPTVLKLTQSNRFPVMSDVFNSFQSITFEKWVVIMWVDSFLALWTLFEEI